MIASAYPRRHAAKHQAIEQYTDIGDSEFLVGDRLAHIKQVLLFEHRS